MSEYNGMVKRISLKYRMDKNLIMTQTSPNIIEPAVVDEYEILSLVHESSNCKDCNIHLLYINEYFRLHDEVRESMDWEDSHDSRLCVGCVEKRLGRKLVAHDFNPNTGINHAGTVSGRLAERLSDGDARIGEAFAKPVSYLNDSREVVENYMEGVPEDYSLTYTKYLKEEKYPFALWLSNKVDQHGEILKQHFLEMILRVPYNFWTQCSYKEEFHRMNFTGEMVEDSEKLIIEYKNPFSEKYFKITLRRDWEPAIFVTDRYRGKTVMLEWDNKYQEVYEYMKDEEDISLLDFTNRNYGKTSASFHQELVG